MLAVDRIALRGLEARGRHGWFDFEQAEGQTFVVDVTLQVDVSRAAESDDLADTVDYGALGKAVVEIVEGEPVRLIETLADRIARACLQYERVSTAEVSVHKPEAPMGVTFRDVVVTVVRSRSRV